MVEITSQEMPRYSIHSVKIFSLICFAGVLFLVQSCRSDIHPEGAIVVARVNNSFLYASDLSSIIPYGTAPADSALIAARFIDNWTRQQVFLQHAIENLDPAKMDFEKRIQDYKNSLIAFAYERELIITQLDTLVTEQQIQSYYDNNRSMFTLKEDIVKVQYIKVPLDAPEVWRLRRLYRSTDPDDFALLEEYCIQHAAAYFIDGDTWLFFRDLMQEIPIRTNNTESYLRNNRYAELTDDYYRYFLHISDYQLKGSESPLMFERDNIRSIILNLRKHTFIHEKRNELFQQAIADGQVEIFPRP